MKTVRKSHKRNYKSGKVTTVRQHAFNAGASNREFDLRWKGDQAYINGSVTYQTL